MKKLILTICVLLVALTSFSRSVKASGGSGGACTGALAILQNGALCYQGTCGGFPAFQLTLSGTQGVSISPCGTLQAPAQCGGTVKNCSGAAITTNE
jgi:hypothetical protein